MEHYSATKRKEILRHTQMNLENFMLSKRIQRKSHVVQFNLYEMSRIGKSTVTESRLQLPGTRKEQKVTANRYGISFVSDVNVLELAVMVIQLFCFVFNILKNYWFYTLNGWILWQTYFILIETSFNVLPKEMKTPQTWHDRFESQLQGTSLQNSILSFLAFPMISPCTINAFNFWPTNYVGIGKNLICYDKYGKFLLFYMET